MSLVIAIALFALSMSISPGPVNMVSLSTGVNYGFWPAMPFVSGAAIGFTLLLLAIGLGMTQLVERVPLFLDVLIYCGAAFICYMGYKIAVSKPRIESAPAKKPNFLHGFLMQWLSPKAWIAGLSGVSAFAVADSYTILFLFCSIHLVICSASIATWAFIGSKLTDVMASEHRLGRFNVFMGVSLVLVAAYLLALHVQGV